LDAFKANKLLFSGDTPTLRHDLLPEKQRHPLEVQLVLANVLYDYFDNWSAEEIRELESLMAKRSHSKHIDCVHSKIKFGCYHRVLT